MKVSPVGNVLIEVAAPSDGASRSALWAYIGNVASRWYGRPTDDEVAAALLDDPSEDLAAPQGAFLIARRGEVSGRPSRWSRLLGQALVADRRR